MTLADFHTSERTRNEKLQIKEREVPSLKLESCKQPIFFLISIKSISNTNGVANGMGLKEVNNLGNEIREGREQGMITTSSEGVKVHLKKADERTKRVQSKISG